VLTLVTTNENPRECDVIDRATISMDPKTQLHTMREGLKLAPEDLDINSLIPLFVPASFFTAGNWPGPYLRLRLQAIALAWAVMLPNQVVRYVDDAVAQYWGGKRIDWKRLAVHNLASLSGEAPGTHAFRRTNGEVYAIAMMQPDGIGPSRLLLHHQLASLFPRGYRVALPEMSCAFALTESLDNNEMSQLQELIERCHQNGTRPLAAGIYSPEDLSPEVADQVPR
jgi:hypothetical protein